MFEVQAAERGAKRPSPILTMAKWPPDDGDLGGRSGGFPGGAGGFDPGDGDFKKGKVKPLIALLLVALVGGGVALFFFGGAEIARQELTPEKVAQLTTQTLMLSKTEQLPKWEGWA